MTTPASRGLNVTQFGWAKLIIGEVQKRQLPERVAIIAIETALTESSLTMYANENNPKSLQLPQDVVGSDHASVGLFQQQVPIWGSTEELMNAGVSIGKFLTALQNEGWQGKTGWQAAQAVQISACADGSNYQADDARANQIVAALWGSTPIRYEAAVAHSRYPDHTVAPGENLTVIAARYPEESITAHTIAAANYDRYPSLRTNINLIKVGWVLRIC